MKILEFERSFLAGGVAGGGVVIAGTDFRERWAGNLGGTTYRWSKRGGGERG